MKTAFIVSPLAQSVPQLDVDYIGMDAGALICLQAGLPLTCAIGDFDSAEDWDQEALKDVPTIRYPKQKNETDSELAVRWCLKKGYDAIILWEGISHRLDHTLINIQLMKMAQGKLILRDTMHECRYISTGETFFDSRYKHISFFPVQESIISLEGFAYDLDHRKVSPSDLFLVSNSVSELGKVTVHQGSLISIQSNEK